MARAQTIDGDRTFNDIPPGLGGAAEVTEHYLTIEADDPFLGVKERRVASEEIGSIDAEVFAAEQALTDAGVEPSGIDAVISYALVPDRLVPASAGAVADRLGIKNAMSWGIEMACASAMAQIATAVGLVETGQARNVLLTQSHLALRTFPLIHPAVPGIGDASTALVISRTGRWPILRTHIVTHGDYHSAVTWVRGSKDKTDPPWWKEGGDYRIGTRFRDGAKELQRDTVAFFAQTLREMTDRAKIQMSDVDLIASVEPRGWIPRAAAQVLGLDPAIVASVYETRGHLGACGPIANLERAYREGRTEGASLAALYAQGAGFTRAGALLKLDGAMQAV